MSLLPPSWSHRLRRVLPTPSPLLRLTMAITSMFGLIVLLADVLLGAFPGRETQLFEQRRLMAESLTVQAASLVRAGQPEVLRQVLDSAVARLPDARHALLRRQDGQVVLLAGQADAQALADGGELSTLSRVVVPMTAGDQPWGRLELGFDAQTLPLWRRWLGEPLVATLLLVSVAGTALIGLYLRRALQHLDPMAVIPERVQAAFDVMRDGVVVLDGRGRVLLTNKAFVGLHPHAARLGPGQDLSVQPWLARGLPLDRSAHPWTQTLSAGDAVRDFALDATDARGQRHPLLVNTMPITDGRGRVQGCVTSFTDLSELHRAHASLQRTTRELQLSNEQVQRQNAELQRMATRDPLTGCLNRRAFNEAFEALFTRARHGHLPLACVILDIDHFKKVNDTHGHGIGDRVIQETARQLGESARASDLVCRYGGEEFVLVLPGMDAAAAVAVAERVRQRVQAECGPAVHEVPGMSVTISLGVAVMDPGLRQPSQMVDHADQALYHSKRSGRNRVTLAPPCGTALPELPELPAQPAPATDQAPAGALPVAGAPPAAQAPVASLEPQVP